MTDEQIRTRTMNKRLFLISLVLLLISGALVFYWHSNESVLDDYKSQKASETSLRSQVAALENENNSLRNTIEQTGKELVSFSENKIMYINLASQMAEESGVEINKFTVSDIWTEGTMSGMTSSIEVRGSLFQIKNFINKYCGLNYTNRVNVISCRPEGRYPWFQRNIDGEQVLTWLDLSYEDNLYQNQQSEERQALLEAAIEAGISIADLFPEEEEENTEVPISLAQMFEDKVFKAYLEIDFLGRQ